MKKLFAAVAAAGMCVSLFAFDVTDYLPLKGSVKSCTRTEYSITSKFGDYFRTPELKTIRVFNGAGKETESSEMTPRDVLVNKIQNTYDAAGKLVSQVGYNSDNALIWKSTVEYGTDGNKSSVSEYGKDGTLKSKTVYIYSGNKLSDETYYSSDGAVASKTTYKYNEAGQLSVESHYYADGSLDEEYDYTYTETGAIDTITYINGYGDITARDYFRWSADGVLTEITTCGADNRTTKRKIIKYDTAGNVAKISTYNVGKKFGTTVTELAGMTEIVCQY
ncbi:MAG: hypothetical protein M0P01_08080 [Treponema sp.]|nr:hypothetical protein [Treponema sp.]